MSTLLDKTFFVNNRKMLFQNTDADVVVIAANGLLQKTADNTFPFVQDSNFWYLTGCDLPDAVLVMSKKTEWLIVPSRSDIRAAFDGAIDAGRIAQRSGIGLVLDEKDGWLQIKNAVGRNGTIASLIAPRSYEAVHGIFTNPARARVSAKLRRTFPSKTVKDIGKVLRDLRVIKQPPEIECLEKAISITKQSIETVTSSCERKKMTFEYELEAALEYSFRTAGGNGHAFSPIVAAGKNATTLHYVHNTGQLHANEFIVIDVGTEIEHYEADISRTVMFGEPTPRQQAVYDAVARTQQRAIEHMVPGVSYREYEQFVTDLIGKELVDLKLINDSHDTDAIRHYYPHASSHFLGLDVHDVGDYRTQLQPGMVLTCEPGIYIPEEGIGVRIEDDILITSLGNRVL